MLAEGPQRQPGIGELQHPLGLLIAEDPQRQAGAAAALQRVATAQALAIFFAQGGRRGQALVRAEMSLVLVPNGAQTRQLVAQWRGAP